MFLAVRACTGSPPRSGKCMSGRLRKREMRVLARVTGTIGIAAVALLAVSSPAPANVNVNGVYAAPHGHGASCTVHQPCSIEQAKTSAARLAAHSQGDVHVELAGGTYGLNAPLSFGPKDSGRGGHRIVWEAASGAQPVLSGGVPVRGWHLDSANPKLWSASVPTGLDTPPLYAN